MPLMRPKDRITAKALREVKDSQAISANLIEILTNKHIHSEMSQSALNIFHRNKGAINYILQAVNEHM